MWLNKIAVYLAHSKATGKLNSKAMADASQCQGYQPLCPVARDVSGCQAQDGFRYYSHYKNISVSWKEPTPSLFGQNVACPLHPTDQNLAAGLHITQGRLENIGFNRL